MPLRRFYPINTNASANKAKKTSARTQPRKPAPGSSSPPPTYMQPTLEQLQQQLDDIQTQLSAILELLADVEHDDTMPASLSLDGGQAYPDREDGQPL